MFRHLSVIVGLSLLCCGHDKEREPSCPVGVAGAVNDPLEAVFDQPCGQEGCTAEAPALDLTVASNLYDAILFLGQGDPPLQEGLVEGSIDMARAAMLRGLVVDEEGEPLPDVVITIQHHAEWGRGRTLADGVFNMGVNGGAPITVNYGRPGFLPVQRTLTPEVQRYTWLADVTLLERTAPSNSLESDAEQAQIARGRVEMDADGKRQGTVILPPETYATAVLPDGTRVPLPELTVRLQEYTVGETGPSAMPGELPATTGYTYAIELSVDEAEEIGARHVEFSQPVAFYVENFLDFPVGTQVPSGVYAAEEQTWVPEPNGRVLEILSEKDGRVALDVDGDGKAEDEDELAALGMSEPELAELGELYEAGQTLWRTRLTHFSPLDCNWPYGPPDDAEPPSAPEPPAAPEQDCETGGSIVHCESQVLGEALGIVGTPYALMYSSRRVPGHRASSATTLQLTGPEVPEGVKFIELEVEIAGQRQKRTYDPEPNLSHDFKWDQNDGFGRPLQGAQEAKVRIGYGYDAVYREGNSGFGAPGGDDFTGNRTRQEVTLWQEFRLPLGQWDARALGFGGWGLNVHHAYDPVGRTVYYGDGSQRSAERIPQTASALAVGDAIGNADALAIDADGNLYASDDGMRLLQRITPAGDVSPRAGNGGIGRAKAGPSTETPLSAPQGVVVDGDVIYLADFNENVVYAIEEGKLRVFAGGGEPEDFNGDGGPAKKALLRGPDGLALGPDGSLYVAEQFAHRVRRVAPDGQITTYAGGGSSKADGALATEANLSTPSGLALAEDGTLYVSERQGHRVRRIDPTGRIVTVAGTGSAGFGGDGGPAWAAKLDSPRGLALGLDGALYIADQDNDRVRKVASDGLITTVVGGGRRDAETRPAATDVKLSAPDGLVFSADGTLFVASDGQLVRVTPELPGLDVDDIVLPSESGQLLYVFNGRGKHLSTRDAFTGATLLAFKYGDDGQLTTVTDVDGLKTTIQRSSKGIPTAIVGPYGHKTQLEVNDDGWLSAATDPMDRTVNLKWAEGGLLTAFIEPNGAQHEFAYDKQGRLISDEDPSGFKQELDRAELEGGFEVTLSTPLGRTAKYTVESTEFGTARTVTGADGHPAVSEPLDPTTTLITTSDGTRIERQLAPDPRWGMLAPYAASVTMTTPSGRTLTAGTERIVELDDPADPLSLVRFEEITTLGERSWRTVYDAEKRVWTTTSPEGRQATSTHDKKGHLVSAEAAGFAPLSYERDDDGRVTAMSEGDGDSARVSNFAYGDDGLLATFRDPTGREWSNERDANGRTLSLTRPDQATIRYAYDERGLLTSVRPPGRPAHAFKYNDSSLLTSYSPPELGGEEASTTYTFNKDNQYTGTELPDGRAIEVAYDDAGRPASMQLEAGSYTVGYRKDDGSVESLTAPSGDELSFQKDGPLALGLTWSGSVNASLSVDYDKDFQIATKQVGDMRIGHEYDQDGLLTQLGPLSIEHDPDTAYITRTRVQEIETADEYDEFGQLVTHTATHAGEPTFSVVYEHDDAGRIIRLAETNDAGTTTEHEFVYDDLGRLVSEAIDDEEPVVYEYDANGNRTSISSEPDFEIEYDDQDRLVKYGKWTYTHSAEGDLLRKDNGSQTYHYEFDEWGVLKAVTLPNGRVVSYQNDAQGRRIARYVDGRFDYGFIYEDDLRPAAMVDADGKVVERYLYGTQLNSPDLIIRRDTVYRVVHDHLGSVRQLLQTTDGGVWQRLDYDVYGNLIRSTRPDAQPFGFAGGLRDPDTHLVRFGAREYDPETGRWLTKDPIIFDGGQTNLYVYAGNDPVNRVDPTGTIAPWVAMGIAGGVLGGGANAAMQVLSGHPFDWASFGVAAAVGAAQGALGGLGFAASRADAAALGALSNVAQYGLSADTCKQDWGGYVTAAVFGGLAGLAGGTVPAPKAAGGMIDTIPMAFPKAFEVPTLPSQFMKGLSGREVSAEIISTLSDLGS